MIIKTDVVSWVNEHLDPTPCTSVELLYDHMDSQSGRCLPLIYQPFDPNNRSHWADRGSMFDYLISTGVGKLLDFGPGDGWPSLILAPHIDKVIGVDASPVRIDECTRNASRMGITNASFVYIAPGAPLPFPDASFDGVTAATSIEQSPEPQATIAGLFRILKPGGRIRIAYEALAQYAGDREREVDILNIEGNMSRLIIYDRDIDCETADHYALTIDKSETDLRKYLASLDNDLASEQISVKVLEELRQNIVNTHHCRLCHPSGETYGKWLREAGFRTVTGYASGASAAVELFKTTPSESRPTTMEGVDQKIRPVVEEAVNHEVALAKCPMITATR